MRRLNPTFPPTDVNSATEEIRQLFEELERAARGSSEYSTGEYTPPLDVYETDRTFEIRMDVPGVRVESLRVVFKHGMLIIVGAKPAIANLPPGSATFHLVEREFGRFARAIRLSGAFDIANSTASLRDGELTIVLPKLTERRGRIHRIHIA